MSFMKTVSAKVGVGIILLIISSLGYAKDILIIEKDQKYFHNNQDVTGSTLEASVGDNLVLTNGDTIEHCVRAKMGDEVLSDSQQKPKAKGGKDIIIKLIKTGNIILKCDIHPSMLLTITVK